MWFNRNPVIPIAKKFYQNKFIVSPAYGRIIDIVETNGYYIIKIMLTIFDVHVQYAPISGTISNLTYVAGNHELVAPMTVHNGKTLNNEHIVYKIKSPKQTIYVRQISGKFARRCISFVTVGDIILQQDPIGRILFGSQVDLIIAKNKNIMLSEIGDYVKGGHTLLAVEKN